ncbi:class I SAM-dependent methyltransferase [Pontibaca salina]|uniref:Class I SAM-dependent methyltransferase n=1 Tax=Pontibaca salina TaxID=2795731 RepID=A0A934HKV3_9RHOB|nr:class I SAM-dependent methyltransferase [Pontibaca salina]MBI6630049.1 class I SAM-dependent methyltransferase [Pontibaca salina]
MTDEIGVDSYTSPPETLLDVPFVPTDENVVEAMLNLGAVGPNDVLYDLGSGDGRILISAARNRDTTGIGVDLDPERIADAMEEAGWAGVQFLVDFIEDDIFTVDISAATVVTLYLLEMVNLELRPRLLSELRPGTRIISHAFGMGDWKPDDWREMSGVNIYKWIVPAQIAGIWEWERLDGRLYRIDLQQDFQEITGTAWLDGEKAILESADLQGARLEVTLRENSTAAQDSFTLHFKNNELHSVKTATPPKA